jgi:hypothetical protein
MVWVTILFFLPTMKSYFNKYMITFSKNWTQPMGMLLLLLSLFTYPSSAQTGQLDLTRVQQMPNLPSPYQMRNWKQVAIQYDQFIYNTSASGQYFPVLKQKAGGVNYPTLQPILLDTYVGSSSSGNQAEAINIIPSLVGATLMGIDKSNQAGINWVIHAKDFFNKANQQNVYLNGYATTSGNDWWYDVIPNVFFYQLYAQYPTTSDFSTQFTSVADRWLQAVQTMGGSATPWTVPQMNYRAFDLLAMKPNANGVIEPEAAGAISWILYHAWMKTGNKKYLAGAQQSMDFLSGLTSNPSYELQLPYGTFIAAKMNAEVGTNYDIAKMLSWSFDRGSLRGWGTIVGTWNGSNVSGLIGEANDAGNDYAFALNGFQQAAAFVPLVKYDKRFAKAIGKWILNLSNASRFFYSKYLPSASQDDFSWSSVNDPNSVIAYEALKENSSGRKLYATGDAKVNGWAQTNLGLYGSSSVGYLAAVVDTTDVAGILLLDVNKTDFFTTSPFPSYLTYNPHATAKQITLSLGSNTYEIYDALSETIIQANATGNTSINLPANEARLLVYLPQGSVPTISGNRLVLGNQIVDYHYGYDYAPKPLIKSIAVKDSLVEFNQSVPVYTKIENAPSATYSWFVNGVLAQTSATNAFTWIAPQVAGPYSIVLKVETGVNTLKDSVSVKVVEHIPTPPVVTEIVSDRTFYYNTQSALLTCNATNQSGGVLVYNWIVTQGTITNTINSTANWQSPADEGLYEIVCEVTNTDGLKATGVKQLLIKKTSTVTTTPLAYYPLDGNVLDYSGNEYHGVLENAKLTPDARGEANKAYLFSTSSDLISVSNNTALNFENQITLSCWIKLVAVPQETFILSHGSWEERWKISMTPDKKLRWSVKTANGIKDLDSSFPLQLNTFYHVTVAYSGYSMELYLDGILDAFTNHSGLILKTGNSISFGKKDVNTTNYYLRGTLDEVRIYNKSLSPNEIETLKDQWQADPITSIDSEAVTVDIYPNPTSGRIHIAINTPIIGIEVVDLTGRKVASSYSTTIDGIEVNLSNASTGLLILRINLGNEIIYKKIVVE